VQGDLKGQGNHSSVLLCFGLFLFAKMTFLGRSEADNLFFSFPFDLRISGWILIYIELPYQSSRHQSLLADDPSPS